MRQSSNSETEKRQEQKYDIPPIQNFNRDIQNENTYEKYVPKDRDRREGAGELQPSVQTAGKHWYDEYPVGDRRKDIESTMKARKDKEERDKLEREVPRNTETCKNPIKCTSFIRYFNR